MNKQIPNKFTPPAGWSEKDLLDYFHGNLSPEQQHELEFKLSSSDLLQDAMEGLNAINQQETIQQTVHQLNYALSRQIKKKNRLHNKPLATLPLLIVSTFLILALIVLAFFVLYKMTLIK